MSVHRCNKQTGVLYSAQPHVFHRAHSGSLLWAVHICGWFMSLLGDPKNCPLDDWTPLLTSTELANLKGYMEELLGKKDMHQDWGCFFNTVQAPERMFDHREMSMCICVYVYIRICLRFGKLGETARAPVFAVGQSYTKRPIQVGAELCLPCFTKTGTRSNVCAVFQI